ncbi:hypothetical protein ACFQZS_08340 [Mucilaginibacter calamicampi]|uniref:DUF4153 domain-containing protein n=1 Tax=Mucilaginibacter calamicampi TaxID=1302352 RepID=A0ABW2YUM7_9SPHI
MKEEIFTHLDNPARLEKMYRANKAPFKRAFDVIYPELKGNQLADFWHERLNYESDDINWGIKGELIFVVVISLIAGLIAKLPHFFTIDEEFFYPRNIGFIVFPFVSAYFAWRNKLSAGKIAFSAVAMLAGLVFINLLPNVKTSDTLILSCIHLALLLWCITGFVYVGETVNNVQKRLSFLKYNGDLVVMTALILIAGGLMSAITVGLFSLIGLRIEEFYFKNIAIFGLAAAPIVGTFLTQTNPQLVGKVSPVIARIFSPLVTVMLVVYLVAIVYSGKNPYNDREFLLIFNALLAGVLAIIFFSAAETAKTQKTKAEIWVLAFLSIITIIVNGVALSAIIYRIATLGITPNRLAVMGGNVLILINLVLVTVSLFRTLTKRTEISEVGKVIASYLPVYFVWTIIVTFIFPLLFSFK